MKIDIKNFKTLNVIDTCSIWNLLSSDKLYELAKSRNCHFCCTKYVIYECLNKSRKKIKKCDITLRRKLNKELRKNMFASYPISIGDLQDIEILEKRKKLGKGELSSIVFAKKTRQSFLTDDQNARKLSESYLGLENTQTIPQLFGWLVYAHIILDTDKDIIIDQHIKNGGWLKEYFEGVFRKALELIQLEKSLQIIL